MGSASNCDMKENAMCEELFKTMIIRSSHTAGASVGLWRLLSSSCNSAKPKENTRTAAPWWVLLPCVSYCCFNVQRYAPSPSDAAGPSQGAWALAAGQQLANSWLSTLRCATGVILQHLSALHHWLQHATPRTGSLCLQRKFPLKWTSKRALFPAVEAPQRGNGNKSPQPRALRLSFLLALLFALLVP